MWPARAAAVPAPRPGREVQPRLRHHLSWSTNQVIRTPVGAPNANAHPERWFGSVRRECLDRLLIFSRRQLEHVLRIYVRHYNEHRPNRALELQAPDPHESAAHETMTLTPIRRRDLLGALIDEYEAVAA
jgi:putative transposase